MQSQFFDFYRAGLRSTTQLMNASLQHTERLQQQQMDLIRNTLQESERSANQLDQLKSLDDLIAHNSRFAGAQLERMTELWSGMWRAAAETHKSVIDLMQSQMTQARDPMREDRAFISQPTEDATDMASARLSAAAKQARDIATQERKAQEQRKTG